MPLLSYHAGRRRALAAALAIASSFAGGCASRSGKDAQHAPSCRDDAIDDVEVGARTGVAGAKTGATTAVEGVKTFGSATAGLVEGGTDEAKTRWKNGAAHTKQTARKGSEETKQEGEIPRCK
jgi:hypothetical protein